jgi:hypothetical protein
VTDTGHRSFVVRIRFPKHPKNLTRRALGTYGRITLDAARQKARHWLELVGKGIDPQIEAARELAAAQRRILNTFGTVAEEFLARHAAPKKRRGEAYIDAEFARRWRDCPIADIAPRKLLRDRAIANRGRRTSHNALTAPFTGRPARMSSGSPSPVER